MLISSFNDLASVPGMAKQDGMSAEWRTGSLDPGTTPMQFVTAHSGVLDYGVLHSPLLYTTAAGSRARAVSSSQSASPGVTIRPVFSGSPLGQSSAR